MYHLLPVGDVSSLRAQTMFYFSIHLSVLGALIAGWRLVPYVEVLCWVVVERKAAATGKKEHFKPILCLPPTDHICPKFCIVTLLLHGTKDPKREPGQAEA